MNAKNIIIFLIVAAILIGIGVYFFSPGEIYYALESDGTLDKTDYYELKNGKWKDAAGNEGKYVEADGKIVFYYEIMGTSAEFASAKREDGKLVFQYGLTYFKEGYEPKNTILKETKNYE